MKNEKRYVDVAATTSTRRYIHPRAKLLQDWSGVVASVEVKVLKLGEGSAEGRSPEGAEICNVLDDQPGGVNFRGRHEC